MRARDSSAEPYVFPRRLSMNKGECRAYAQLFSAASPNQFFYSRPFGLGLERILKGWRRWRGVRCVFSVLPVTLY